MSAANILMRRVRVLLDRTVLNRVAYRGKQRLLQVSSRADTAQDGVEHLEPYGFTSHPLAGATALVGNLGGNGGRAVVILVNDRRHRIVVDEGEVAIYHQSGDFVHLKNGGEIHVKAASRVYLETPLVECSANLRVRGTAHFDGAVAMLNTLNVAMTVTLQAGLSVAGNTTSTGNFTTSGQVSAGGVSLRTHTHSGVQTGSGTTGGPT